jgi:glyoxalase family protein
MALELSGLHHLTAVTANAPRNVNFYTDTLGLRLVKKTVNQDDTSAYHLFYADGEARPGTDMTFFDWPVGKERRGTHSVVRTGYRLASEASLDFWAQRLADRKVLNDGIKLIGGRPSLDFEDPEGQRLRFVVDETKDDPRPWERSPVPAEHQIRGLGPITMSVPDLKRTDLVLTDVMNMTRGNVFASPDGVGEVNVYTMGGEGPAAELHVAVQPGLPASQQGAGSVHHVAFRTPDGASMHEWTQRLREFRVPSSGEVERYYFRSLYFREPGGVLFEIATDGPGFTADEPLATLGERLSLPPFLEPKREQIEARLKPLS